MELTPITFELELPVDPTRAFAAFVDLGAWWDPRYTRDAATYRGGTIEPAVGGRVLARYRDGDDVWGHVSVWEPPRELACSFTLAMPPDVPPSELRVGFAPAGAGCTVTFAHGGWTAANAAQRSRFREWPLLLDRFAAHARGDRRP